MKLRDASLAVVDQGLAAGNHLAVHVLSARWMAPEVYGAFALVFTLYQVAHIVHSSLVTEPLLVFGASRYQDGKRRYFASLVRAQSTLFFLACVVGVGVGATMWNLGVPSLGVQLGVATPALVGMLFLSLGRRWAYLAGRPGVAATASGIYFVVSMGLLITLGRAGWLLPWLIWGTLGLAGVVAASAVGVFRSSGSAIASGSGPLDVRDAHWRFGRWLLLSGLLGFLVSGLSPWLLGAFHGLAVVGSYRAVLNLALPGLQASAALTVLAMPYLARLNAEHVWARWFRLCLPLGAAFAVYLAAVVLFGRELMYLAYGNDDYIVSNIAITLAGALPLLYLPLGLGGMLLKARGRPREFTLGSVATGSLGLLVGVPMIAMWDLQGALAATGVAYMAGGGVTLLLGFRLTRPSRADNNSD